MDELEKLRDQAFIAKNRIAELQQELTAAVEKNRELLERLTLTQKEREILHGHEDGCVRLGDLRPILRRIFGEAA